MPNLYLLAMLLATTFSWSAFGLVLTRLDPFTNPILALTCFYLTLFFACTGTFTLLGYAIRTWILRRSLYFQNFNTSFRQGALLSFASSGLLFFQSLRILNWWDGFIIAVIVLLIELLFLSRGRTPPTSQL